MMNLDDLKKFLEHPELKELIEQVWDSVGQEFLQAQINLPAEIAMPRKEISFHEQVKLLGYLCWLVSDLPGDIIEIGVWKGRSISFMSQVCQRNRRIFGIDPMELPNQEKELNFYHEKIFPEVNLIRGYSENCIDFVQSFNPKTLVLHIDGGHQGRNVLLDFLLYSPTVVSGGFIIFDDYRDYQYSPEVGPAVDLLRIGGYFNGYDVIGSVPGYENSYLLQKK
ncbi:class I SAM-dependent methyltransferase [Pectobacterium colocasium]|uniref:class I SAM-dependent methyltransferase n=1 Tax=Pectobacterium TaxID=122277 RepID=UPI003D729B32